MPKFKIGDVTRYGVVEGIAFTGGERYYFLLDEDGTVKFFPEFILEKEKD